jgi:hypothetical protein
MTTYKYNTLDAALDALNSITSTGDDLKAALLKLAGEVSTGISEGYTVNPNATTVLYGGMIGGVKTGEDGRAQRNASEKTI